MVVENMTPYLTEKYGQRIQTYFEYEAVIVNKDTKNDNELDDTIDNSLSK